VGTMSRTETPEGLEVPPLYIQFYCRACHRSAIHNVWGNHPVKMCLGPNTQPHPGQFMEAERIVDPGDVPEEA
jgi:hypothetical protein